MNKAKVGVIGGTGVLGGMVTATFLAIFFIPLFYVIVVQLFGEQKSAGAEESGSQVANISETK